MACLSRSFRALLWRNAIYRKRRWLPSLIEFFLPPLCVAILYFIKLSLQNDPNSTLTSVVVPASYPGSNDAIIPFSFQDYATALQANRTCVVNPTASAAEKILGLAPLVISGINYQDWPVPFVFCNSYLCKEQGESAQKYCMYRTLALAPMNAGAKEKERMLKFKDYVEEKYPQITDSNTLPFDYDFIRVFDSNDALDAYITSDTYGATVNGEYFPTVAIAVVFSGGDNDKLYEYTIRTNSTNYNSEEQGAQPGARTTPSTKRVFSPYKREDSNSCENTREGTPDMGPLGGSCTGQYMLNGAVTIQRLLDDWILSDSGVVATVAQNGAVFLPFPTKEYTESGFYESIGPFAPLLFTIGLLYPVSSTIRSVVLEKELRQKELMKMMSVTECDIGWSWFVSFYAFFAVPGVLTAIFTNLLYSSSEFFWLFVFWQFSFIACIVYCCFVASFSTKATRATLIGIMLFFVGYFLPFVVDYQDASSALIVLVSLHPVTAYTYGLTMMGYLEGAGVGVKSTTITSSGFPSRYTFSSSLFMLLFDSIFWGVASWYLNRIMRGDYGTALKWYFPFTSQYWCPKKTVAIDPTSSIEEANKKTSVPTEEISEALKKQQEQDNSGVHIFELRKQFGEKTAVDGLNLSMYQGQITACLGHNGAGKTTTIGMLTGMVPPTSGSAVVAGYDIRSDLTLLRQNVGVCLQHDCLFPQLTVLEHMVFFSKIKGFDSKKTKEECKQELLTAIEDVALLEKRHSFAKDLSGGMKRKLSVAIAFCGNSKVVFLDEPTSGMDPFARRFTWNVIRKYRENRVIVLTTHFMDEADLLGDRIAIMAEGQLRCVGSSLFLKKKYGVGYQLTIIKNSIDDANSDSLDKVEVENNEVDDFEKWVYSAKKEKVPSGDEFEKWMHSSKNDQVVVKEEDKKETESDMDDVLRSIVKGSVPSASVLSNVGTELKFQLPIGESAKFIAMFEKLDTQIKHHKIKTYGVSVTTLDEVFLMVARGEDGLHLSSEQEDTSISDKEPVKTDIEVTDDDRFRRHVQALFLKRALNFKRDKKAWCCSTILPTLTTLFGFLLVNMSSRQSPNYPSLTLTLDQNNPEVAVDRNPIMFNDPGVYDCQPGRCIYGDSTANISETSELYFFCGANAKVGGEIVNDTAFVPMCTIKDSPSIIDQISQWGSFGVGIDVSDVLNTSKSVYNSSNNYDASMYGNIFFNHDENSIISTGGTFDDTVTDLCENNPGNYSSVEQCAHLTGLGYIINYNYTSLHSSLLYQATADEALIRKYLNDTDYKISVSVHPLPVTKEEEQYKMASNTFSAWFLIVLSFPFIAGSFATFIVFERESKAKHLQTVAGVSPTAYWLSTYLWDVMNYQIPLWTVIALMYIFDVQSFIAKEYKAAESTIALLVLFGPAAAGFTYIISFCFKSPSMANLFVIVFNFIIGMAGPLVCFILRLIAADVANPKPNLKNAAIITEWVLRLIPSFCLGRGLLYTINITFFEFIEAKPLDTWSPAVALYDVIVLGIQTVLYFAFTICIDILSTKPKTSVQLKKVTNFLTCQWLFGNSHQADDTTLALSVEDDEDVIAENQRVQSGQANNDLILLKELTKQYSNGKKAVNFMSLGIPPGECFGCLGVNGAGKTTCMGMLTAEFPPSSGDALLAGFSVTNEPEQTRRQVGYCPQFDAHFANMTGWEHIELYAVIKGVRRNVVKEIVESKLNEVGLSDFDGKRLSSGYSGGMKRKLSVACATIGAPRIVFLDEPSTGMDPVARRDLWKVISKMVQGRSGQKKSERTSVILTTHSMEECEALCPRIGIMAGGKLRCLGSAQHLKNRFGQGYQIEMKVKNPLDEDRDVIDTTRKALKYLQKISEDLETGDLHRLAEDTSINLDQTQNVCMHLTGDDYLSKMINSDNPTGYHIAKLASTSVGITVDELVGFCVEELRVKAVVDFFQGSYKSAILRERQDSKVRYEILSEGVTISSVFANIEQNKDDLMIDDYGVSQTSLEQVFNSFAAVAENDKKNTVDGVQAGCCGAFGCMQARTVYP